MYKYQHFTHYELQALRKVQLWQKEMLEPQHKLSQISKQVQDKINKLIPQKVHNTITLVMRKMVEAVLFSSEFIKPAVTDFPSLETREATITKRMEYYRGTAAAEGGITGFGGIMGTMADFPVLLTLKLKFLFDVASIYGYQTANLSERIYLLNVFQLAFSSPVRKADTFSHLAIWAALPESIPNNPNTFDWYRFQQDYRDYIDLAKLLQMLPGIGAAVGIVANYSLLNQLSETAVMCYRMRWLNDKASKANKVLE